MEKYIASASAQLVELRDMVNAHKGAPRQRSQAWYDNKAFLVGGSEISTLLGINPFSSRLKLLARKAGLDSPGAPGIACWWGTMFEPVTEALVAIGFACPVIGTDIHIHSEALPAHANSPDGYTIVPFEAAADGSGAWDICLDPVAAILRGADVVPVAALVELKAPYSRIPKGAVPAYYVPQLLSGMALSPAAATGIYVEAVYRLCSFGQLFGAPDAYARNYHAKDAKAKKQPLWAAPVAVGLTAFYAPRAGTRRARGAPSSMAAGARGADQVCIDLLTRGCEMRVDEISPGSDTIDVGEAADAEPARFNALMQFVDSGEVTVRHSAPVMCDRGEDPVPPLKAFMAAVEGGAGGGGGGGAHHYLLGYLPWKVFQVDYHQVRKDPDFIEQIREPVEDFMEDLLDLTSAADPAAAYRALQVANMPTPAARHKKLGNDDHVADLFAMCAS